MRPAVEQQLDLIALHARRARDRADAERDDHRVLQVAFSRQALAAGIPWPRIARYLGEATATAARRFYYRNEKAVGPSELRDLEARLGLPNLTLKG